jgi:site-specific recombinase XerD
MSKQLSTFDDAEFEKLVDLVANGKSKNTRLAYRRALRDFRSWYEAQPAEYKTRYGLSRASVMAYVDDLAEQGLSPATINQRLAAIRALAKELHYSQIGIFADRAHADAIMEIENVPNRGVRTGYWLTPRQAKELMTVPDQETLRGKQQMVVLGLLMGCALRREEAADVTVDMIQPRNSHWVIANIEGKGNKVRTVPIPPWVLNVINVWRDAAGIKSGKLLRAVNKADRLAGPVATKSGSVSDGGLSPQAIYNIVKDLSKASNLPADLGPHDLRRTWGKRAYQQNAPLDQISLILGHASISTTEIYLGLRGIDLESPVYVTY